LVAQAIEADEHGVAGKCRETLIWRVPVTGWTERQDLPDRLTSGGKKIYKFEGCRTEIAYTERTRQ
jgi:hypothetical protein